ncbi:ArsR family transcriptional regulator [Candidatus Bathyarchaeota archaeon]|nr:ArsR family transcriptional regulator [Candidatus Bathyarchaeota archaeon]
MTENTEHKILEILKTEPKGMAALLVAKKSGLSLLEVIKTLEALIQQGKVKKKGKIYRAASHN